MKTNAKGAIERYKTRLVACGNEHLFGIEYLLTFAPVTELGAVKVTFVYVRHWKVPARHGDVPKSYATADKEPGVDSFMRIPKGW